MDTRLIIAHNLNAWMRETPGLETLDQVVTKSGAGYGTVRRARNGNGNPTIEALDKIAYAFKRPTIDLFDASDLASTNPDYKAAGANATVFHAREPEHTNDLAIESAVRILRSLDDKEKALAIKILHTIAK